MPAALLSKDKIVSLAVARAFREELRGLGKRVGLCNGVFDLLHVGHVRYLEAARGLCDGLVVAVNSDRSTRELKGAGRPLVPELERAEVVAGLAAVDRVVIFDGRDVSDVLRELRPDLQIKGTDYTLESVPERALVESLGGRVAIAGDPKDHSSSELARRAWASSRRAWASPRRGRPRRRLDHGKSEAHRAGHRDGRGTGSPRLPRVAFLLR